MNILRQKPALGTPYDKFHPLVKGIVGHWLFNDSPPLLGVTEDLSGNGNHGTIMDDTHSVPGRDGPALKFDGASDYVSCGSSSTLHLGTHNYTIVSWCKISSTPVKALNTIFANGSTTSSEEGFYFLYNVTPGDLRFTISNGAARTISTSDGSLGLDDDTWHQMAVSVVRSGDATFYVDGINVGAGSVSARSADDVGGDRVNSIGILATNFAMTGQIGSVKIYDRALSVSEIASLYRDPFQMFEREPAIFYSFAAGGEAIVRTIDDSLGVTDAQTKSVTFARTFAESVGVTDVTAKIAIHLRVLAESLGITDATVKAETKLLTEALGITDTQTKDETKVLAESLGITDSVIRTCIIIRAFAESLGITDAVSQAAVLSRVLSEALGVTDVMTRTQVQTRIETESIGITDVVIKTQVQLRVITDILGITDAMQRGRFITFTESMGITDDIAKLITFIRTESEVVGITDSIVRVAVMLRTVSDDLGLTDEVSEELGALVKAAWAFVILRQTHS